ncbi:MAG: DDE transposase family protein [Candidatus Kryptoniota bacterium]|jgi:transcriptional regulator with XRE-family HTH domain
MKAEQKKELAKLLFVNEKLSQKEIAQRVEISEKTLSRWVNDGQWRKLRQSLLVTKEEQLRRIYEQIDELNTAIASREPGQRYANTKDADTLSKLTSAAKNLESEASISDIISVAKRFLNWLRPLDIDKAKEISSLIDAFIKDQLKR